MFRIIALLLIAMPAAGHESLSPCRSIADAELRLRCYDDVVDARQNASPTPSAPEISQTAEPSSPSNSSAGAPAPSEFGKPKAQPKVKTAISATLTKVSKTPLKKLLVELDNDQIWQQLDSLPMRLKSGDAVVIRQARLNSYLLRKQSGGRSIRVKRLQ